MCSLGFLQVSSTHHYTIVPTCACPCRSLFFSGMRHYQMHSSNNAKPYVCIFNLKTNGRVCRVSHPIFLRRYIPKPPKAKNLPSPPPAPTPPLGSIWARTVYARYSFRHRLWFIWVPSGLQSDPVWVLEESILVDFGLCRSLLPIPHTTFYHLQCGRRNV